MDYGRLQFLRFGARPQSCLSAGARAHSYYFGISQPSVPAARAKGILLYIIFFAGKRHLNEILYVFYFPVVNFILPQKILVGRDFLSGGVKNLKSFSFTQFLPKIFTLGA